MQFYNVLFTALPCIVFAIFDKDVDDRISMDHPELYRLGVEDGIFTTKAMLSWMVSGIYHSAIIFFLGYYQFAFGGHAFESGLDGDLVQFGILTFFVLVIITNVRAGMIALTWTWLMPTSLIFSIFSFIIVAFFIGTSAPLTLPSRSTSSFLSRLQVHDCFCHIAIPLPVPPIISRLLSSLLPLPQAPLASAWEYWAVLFILL